MYLKWLERVKISILIAKFKYNIQSDVSFPFRQYKFKMTFVPFKFSEMFKYCKKKG